MNPKRASAGYSSVMSACHRTRTGRRARRAEDVRDDLACALPRPGPDRGGRVGCRSRAGAARGCGAAGGPALQSAPSTLIRAGGPDAPVATIGSNGAACDAAAAALVARGAGVVQPPQNRPYGARVAYLQGPGALTIELEQMLSSAV